jgi:predicted phosphodiesterase
MPTRVSDQEFIATWKRFGSPSQVAKALGLDLRGVYSRRKKIEEKHGFILETMTESHTGRPKVAVPKKGFRALAENVTGTVIIGSDMHAWPGERSVAFGAMIKLIKELKPSMIIINGDSVDGARISRHPPGGWADLPDVADELAAVQERHGEIEAAAPPGVPLVWAVGNHDQRFTSRLAQAAPEYMRVKGADITDHFPSWEFCWSIFLNGHTVVKHRWHQGVHGAYQNALKGGKNIVTGHTHRLHATMWADYNGLRWGIECGTLSDFGPETDKFAYGEDAPHNWSQGFVVLTFDHKGMLLEPEFCRVMHGAAYFRGQIVSSKTDLISSKKKSKLAAA